MRENQTARAFVSFGQCSEKIVLEGSIPSSSTQNVLAQYLRRILTITPPPFPAPYLSSLFPLFALFLFALCLFALCLIALSICVTPFRVTYICVMPFRVMPFRVTSICVMPFGVMPLFVRPFRVMPFRVMPICVMPFTSMPFRILTICMIPETGFYPSASGGCIHDLEHTIPITQNCISS